MTGTAAGSYGSAALVAPGPVMGAVLSFIFRAPFWCGFGCVVWFVFVTVPLHEEEGRAFEPFLLQECNGVLLLFFFFSIYITVQKKKTSAVTYGRA